MNKTIKWVELLKKLNFFKDAFLDGLKSIKINDDFTVDVNGNVFLFEQNLNEIPIQFGIVSGYFDCSHNKLTTLKNCPKEVVGNFYCDYNQLTTLKGCPEYVGGNFYCTNNKLENLKDCPERVGGDLHCEYNNITSLKGINVVDGKVFKN